MPVAPLGQGGPFSGENGSEVTLREYWRVLYKYRYLIGLCVVVSVALSLVYAFTVTPLYTASAKLRISTYQPVLSDTRVEDTMSERSKEVNYLETQIQEIMSLSLADKVLEDQKIRDQFVQQGKPGFLSRWFFSGAENSSLEQSSGSGEYKAPIRSIKKYLDVISVEPVRRTALVYIRATSENPEFAARIANKHSLGYIEWVRQGRVQQQSSGLTFLRSQADEYREKVGDLERELADYAEANAIVAINKDENVTAQKMSQLNRLLTDATAKRIEAENAYKESDTALSTNSAGYDDASTQTMRSELARLEGEYSQLSAKFNPTYPRMVQTKAQIDRIKSSIGGQRKQIVSGLKARALAAAQEEKQLKEELAQQTSKTFELSKKQVQYNVLNRELTSSRELLESVLKQMKEMSLAAESNASNVSVVDYASVPASPSYPRKGMVALIGLVGGMALGILAAFLLSYLDNTVRTPEDLITLVDVPSLGIVPSFEERRDNHLTAPQLDPSKLPLVGEGNIEASPAPNMNTGGPGGFPIVYVNNPKSLASEAYRTIRTGILLSQAGEPPRTLLITSAQSSEGKTTSTVNLAASLASAGGRVVLIDADLRRPSVHKYFNLSSGLPGIVEIITGLRRVDEVKLVDVIKRVTVIPSGRIPPNPAELLGSLEMANLIDRLANEYDYVLIDSPPILPVTDSVILSRYVDGVVLVVKGASTPKKVVRDARARLEAVGARVLGAILNNVDVTGGDYYYYNRYYYSYYQESDGENHSGTRKVVG